MNTELMFSSKTAEWFTPQDLFDQINSEFNFTLDAAASASNAKVSSYYALDHPDPDRRDGLAGAWRGRVWVNPPYGRGVGKWVQKGWESAVSGEAALVVMLLPARTDTQWFHRYCFSGENRFIKGRVKFGGCKNAAPFPSMVTIFRGAELFAPYVWSRVR